MLKRYFNKSVQSNKGKLKLSSLQKKCWHMLMSTNNVISFSKYFFFFLKCFKLLSKYAKFYTNSSSLSGKK